MIKRAISVVMFVIYTLTFFSSAALASSTYDRQAIWGNYPLTDIGGAACNLGAAVGSFAASAARETDLSKLDGTTDAFVEVFADAALQVGIEFGIPYEAILAQGAMESGRGLSELTKQGNNFFGIKAGSSWTGATIEMDTEEEDSDGNRYNTRAVFRKYATAEDGFRGYGEFISTSPHFKDALDHPDDPTAYIYKLFDQDESGEKKYATGSGYIGGYLGVLGHVLTKLGSMGMPQSSSAGCVSANGLAQVFGDPNIPDGWTFPLDTNKTTLSSPEYPAKLSNVPCGNSSCHHDYPAIDIGGEGDKAIGTKVLAVLDGTVYSAGDSGIVCSSSSTSAPYVKIDAADGRRYYYTHLNPGSVDSAGIRAGAKVVAGQVLGEIGPSACAQGTPPHLHIDMSYPNGQKVFSRIGPDYIAAKRYVQNITSFINRAYEELSP